MKKLVLITTLLSLILPLRAQDILQGQMNRYLPVQSVDGTDAVIISDTTGMYRFHAGDKILLIQMTGITLQTFPTPNWEKNPGLRDSWQSTGKYEFVSISSVDKVNKKIIFTSDLYNAYDAGEKIQLVKVIESDYAAVNNTLVAKKWDGNTGGIIALVVYRKLILNSDIDVTGMGFLGGQPETNYSAGCRANVAGTDTFYFQSTLANRAGFKGQGAITATFPYMKGAGHAMNGGGGGNGLYSGGGGGSNYGQGGIGGLQSDACSSDLIIANGGRGLDSTTFYFLSGVNQKRVIMGGGGGSTTTDGSSTAFKGGDGGGLVFIITDTLQSNGGTISANGLNGAAGAANAGGSGGGGGGSVVLDVNKYIGTLNIEAKGGNGGATGDNCNGAGGGGGGGVVLYTKPITGSNIDLSRGNPGAVGASCLSHQGTPGQVGETVSGQQTVLNGFYFNTISGVDTVCEGQVPNMLTGSIPKGGNGNFDYQWQKKGVSESTWTNVGSTADSLFYTPDPLTETTYFRRYLSPDTTGIQPDTVQTDTSKAVEIFVYPKIDNNVLNLTDTICQFDTPGTISGGTLSGGDGNYNYKWEKSTDQQNWEVISNNQAYTEGQLQQTTYYRRIVTSAGICSDTSETGSVKVYEVPQANAGADESACGLTFTLNAIPSVGNGLWEASGSTFAEPNQPSTQVTVGNYGTTAFTWKETNWECSDQDEVKITFYQQPGPTDAGVDQTLDYDFTAQMDALPADVGTGHWSFIQGSGDFMDTANAKTTVHFNNIGDNVLRWTVQNGVCQSVSDSVKVKINDLQIEKGFSPNGDGVNDEFVIDLKDMRKGQLTIFNRWGNVVFQSDDYTKENYWDGKDKNGKDVPDDTYYYILNEEGRGVRKGFVELRR